MPKSRDGQCLGDEKNSKAIGSLNARNALMLRSYGSLNTRFELVVSSAVSKYIDNKAIAAGQNSENNFHAFV
jgi:hypothetical protein